MITNANAMKKLPTFHTDGATALRASLFKPHTKAYYLRWASNYRHGIIVEHGLTAQFQPLRPAVR